MEVTSLTISLTALTLNKVDRVLQLNRESKNYNFGTFESSSTGSLSDLPLLFDVLGIAVLCLEVFLQRCSVLRPQLAEEVLHIAQKQ